MGLIIVAGDRVCLRDVVAPVIVVFAVVLPVALVVGVVASNNRTREKGRGNVFRGFTVFLVLLMAVCLFLLTVVVMAVIIRIIAWDMDDRAGISSIVDRSRVIMVIDS